MSVISAVLPWVEILSALLIVPAILLQQSGAGLGGALGGGDNVIYRTKRGPEKFFFVSSIVLGIILVTASVVDLFFI